MLAILWQNQNLYSPMMTFLFRMENKMRSKNHQISDFPTPRYSNDPQKENDNPRCEKKNFTYEPELEMCSRCGAVCEESVENES